MKKFLIIILAIILLSIASVFLFINSIIKTGVEEAGSRILGVPVTLSSASLSVFSGQGELSGLTIGNVQGFSSPNIFKLSKVSVDMDVWSVFSDTITINKIHVESPDITYEIANKGSNINVLKKKVTSGGSSAAEDSEESAEDSGPGKLVIIKDLQITNGKVNLNADLAGQTLEKTVELSDIKLENLGSDGRGVTGQKVTEIVLATLMKNIVKEGLSVQNILRQGPAFFLEQGSKGIDGVKDAGEGLLKSLF